MREVLKLTKSDDGIVLKADERFTGFLDVIRLVVENWDTIMKLIEIIKELFPKDNDLQPGPIVEK